MVLWQADGHSDKVTGICWSADLESLYSCSTDRHVIEWNVATSSVRQWVIYPILQRWNMDRYLFSATFYIQILIYWSWSKVKKLNKFYFRSYTATSGTGANISRSGIHFPTSCAGNWTWDLRMVRQSLIRSAMETLQSVTYCILITCA